MTTMKRAAVTLAGLLLLALTCSRSRAAERDDPVAIGTAIHQQLGLGKKAGSDGVGASLQKCLEQHGDTLGMNACLGDAYARYDKVLNAIYRKVLADSGAETRDALRAARSAEKVARLPRRRAGGASGLCPGGEGQHHGARGRQRRDRRDQGADLRAHDVHGDRRVARRRGRGPLARDRAAGRAAYLDSSDQVSALRSQFFHCRNRRSRREPTAASARLKCIALAPVTCTQPRRGSNFCA